MRRQVIIQGNLTERQLSGCLSSCQDADVIPARITRVSRTEMVVELLGTKKLFYVSVKASPRRSVTWTYDPFAISQRLRSASARALRDFNNDPGAPRRVVRIADDPVQV